MGLNMRNSLTDFLPEASIIVAEITGDSSTPTISNQSGNSIDRQVMSIARDGAGDYDITVTNFRGAQSKLAAFGTATTISNMISVTAASYTASTDTAVFTVKVESEAGTAVDHGFYILLLAY